MLSGPVYSLGGEFDFGGDGTPGPSSTGKGEKRTFLSDSGDDDLRELFFGEEEGLNLPSSSSFVHAGFFKGPRALPLKASMVWAVFLLRGLARLSFILAVRAAEVASREWELGKTNIFGTSLPDVAVVLQVSEGGSNQPAAGLWVGEILTEVALEP